MAELSGNTCSIITILPMGVSCITTNATNYNSNDGTMTLQISGGTSPYTIYWSNGSQNTISLFNVTPGTYTATVVDFYGDYTASTTCTVGYTNITPTPTMTPTPSATPTPYIPTELCLRNNTGTSAFTFSYVSQLNGKPYWSGISQNIVYNSTTSYWYVSGWTGGGTMVQYTGNYIPTGSWINLGSVNPSITWSVITGTCTTAPMTVSITKTNETCLGSCDGTLNVSVLGGTSPFTYSLNGGVAQSSNIFTEVCAGSGTVTVEDASGNTATQSYTINAGSPSQAYTLTLNQTTTNGLISSTSSSKTMNWNISSSPAVPVGGSISGIIVFTHMQTNNKVTSPTQNASFTTGSTITATGGASYSLITSGSLVTGSNAVPGCINSSQEYSARTMSYSFTIPNGGSISGVVTSLITNPFPENPSCPVYGTTSDSFSLSNITINGISCGNPNPSTNSITLTNTTNVLT
jgi:hypothetical protein